MTFSISQTLRRLAHAATAIALLTTNSAIAADLPVKASPPPVAAPLWTGFYIGVHGGAGQGRSRAEDPSLVFLGPSPVYVDSRGALAGVQVGADWQFGNVVIGGEIDVSWSSIKGSRAPDPAFPFSGISAEYKALATGTGRVGYAYGNLLGYVKGGVASANIDYRTIADPPFAIVLDHQRTGLTAGAGLEFALIGDLSVRAEYDFMYFGATAMSAGCRNTPCNVDHELHLVKLGLNWRFTGDYLTARY
jgi:outer membrane immunogenic protein